MSWLNQPIQVFTLGTLTFGGRIIQSTKDELTILMVGEQGTIRIPNPAP